MLSINGAVRARFVANRAGEWRRRYARDAKGRQPARSSKIIAASDLPWLCRAAAAAFFKGSGATAAQDASDRIIYDTATGDLYYDSDGINGAAAIKFATLDNIPLNLSAGDFLVA